MLLDWTSPLLTFTWLEHDGPPVTPPVDAGFGSRILGPFAKSFCRSVDTCYAQSGLRYTLQIQSDQIIGVEPAPASAVASNADAPAAAGVGDARPSRLAFARAVKFKQRMM